MARAKVAQGKVKRAVAKKSAVKQPLKAVQVRAYEAHIGDLAPDPENARKHTVENVGLIGRSLRELGTGRSLLLGRGNKIIGGNATTDAAAAEGFEKVLIIESDGKTLIAVRRTDLTPQQERRMALMDNRAAELSTWQGGVIAAFAKDDPSVLEGIFGPADLTRLFAEASADFRAQGIEGGPEGDPAAPIVPDSTVRMQQLFLDMQTFPEFHGLCESLMKRWATTTPTDTVMEALRRCAAHPKI